jgi:hypothetical protein
MIYRFRIILDVKEDVLRDIEIESTATLEDFHNAITQAFGFLGNEMATFYRTNSNWEQGDEYPLESMDSEQKSERYTLLNTLVSKKENQLLYVYDFLNLWTFFIVCMEVTEPVVGTSYPNLIHSQGEVPEQAPEKLFESDQENIEFLDEEEDNFEDDFGYDGDDEYDGDDYY